MNFEIKSEKEFVVDLPQSIADEKMIQNAKTIYPPLGIEFQDFIPPLKKEVVRIEKKLNLNKSIKIISKTNINRYYKVDHYIEKDEFGVYVKFRYELYELDLFTDWINSDMPDIWHID